jgi:hypothetical protein
MKYEDTHNEDEFLDQLFQSARTQKPKYQFSEASSFLTGGVALGATTAAHAKVITSTLFKSKLIIMSVSATTIITSTALIYSSLHGSTEAKIKAEKPIKPNAITVVMNTEKEAEQATNEPYLAQFPAYDSPDIPDVPELLGRKVIEVKEIVLTQNSGKTVSKTSGNEPANTGEAPSFHFTITENTTIEELKSLKEIASNAGIKLSYRVKIRQNAIRTIQLTMRSEDKSMVSRYAAGSKFRNTQFTIDLAWLVDENGQFAGMDENRRTPSAEFEEAFDLDLAQMDDEMAAMEIEMERMDAEMARQDEMMLLMEPKMKAMDSLMLIHNQIVLRMDEKLALLQPLNDEHLPMIKKYQELDDKRQVMLKKDKNTEEIDKEIALLEEKLAAMDEKMANVEVEIQPFEIELQALGEEIEAIGREMEILATLSEVRSDFEEIAELPDMPELAELAELPEIPEAPEVPEMAELAEMDEERATAISGKYKRVHHVVTNETNESDLQDIQREALDAGIEFFYTAQYKRGKLVSVEIRMNIVQENGKKLNYDLYSETRRGSTFSNPIIWRVNEAGQAVDFGDPNAE